MFRSIGISSRPAREHIVPAESLASRSAAFCAASSMPLRCRTSAPSSATSPGSRAGSATAIPVARSPTKLSAACLNISPAIVASGRERRRNLSEGTDNDYTDTIAGRPSRAAARAPSAFDLRCRRIGTRVDLNIVNCGTSIEEECHDGP